MCACLLLSGLVTVWADPLEGKPQDRKVIIEKVAHIYTSQIGVREATGHNDGVEVEKYLSTTGAKKGSAWCAAFLSWTFIQADVTAIKNAWAPSWFPPGKVIYTKGKPNNKIPDRCDVAGLYSPQKQLIFHVFFVDQWPPNDDYVITVEGNTNNAGSSEGDGVYKKRRLKQNIYSVSRWV